MSETHFNPPTDLRPIPGFDGYFISPRGEFWSNRPRGFDKRRLLRPKATVIQSNGYVHCTMCIAGKSTARWVHRLVLETFVGPCPDGMTCRHFNGDQQDNRLENLSWGTGKEQFEDKVRHETAGIGEKNSSAKIMADDVREIRRRRNAGETLQSIADDYSISVVHVYKIWNRDRWKHVV